MKHKTFQQIWINSQTLAITIIMMSNFPDFIQRIGQLGFTVQLVWQEYSFAKLNYHLDA